MTTTVLRYIGARKVWRDPASGVVFTRGEDTAMPVEVAAELLKLGSFEAAEAVALTPEQIEEAEALEILESLPPIRLDNMTKDQMLTYAMRHFGVRLDTTDLKIDVRDSMRHLMRRNGMVGV